jgi:plasmid stabilization system protein ParE
MSVPRRTVTLARKAQADFAGIMAYTVEQWGAHQRDIYAEKLLAGFDTIAHFPEIGEDRSDITPGVFSHRIEQHVVYYRFSSTRVRVLRLRHVRVDTLRSTEL